jgi:hypothetical protein
MRERHAESSWEVGSLEERQIEAKGSEGKTGAKK